MALGWMICECMYLYDKSKHESWYWLAMDDMGKW